MKKLRLICDASESQEAMRAHIQAHDNLANEIRYAILNSINPDPNVCVEDKLAHLNPIAFQVALADVAAEVDGLVEDIRRFASDDDDDVI